MTTSHPQAISRLHRIHRGKTRETYATRRGIAKPRTRAVYATDNISTHDVVHLSTVPKKGEVLTALTIFWFTTLLRQMPNHLVAYGHKIYEYLDGAPSDYPADMHLRSIIVLDLKMIPVEFIIRAYLAGSLYRDYVAHALQNPYGIEIPYWMPRMTEFKDPIFTPTKKSEVKDTPLNSYVTYAQYPEASDLMFQAYALVREYANRRGVEIVDWKGEVGIDPVSGKHVLADEVGTPDCCRFCDLSAIREGAEPRWLDKQIARDEAEKMWAGAKRVPLTFTPETIQKVSETYLGVFKRITGMDLEEFQRTIMQ